MAYEYLVKHSREFSPAQNEPTREELSSGLTELGIAGWKVISVSYSDAGAPLIWVLERTRSTWGSGGTRTS